MKHVKDMKDAVDNILAFILCEIGSHTGKLYLPPVKLTTNDEAVIFLDDEITIASPLMVGLVDAYNYIVYGKVQKEK